MNTGVQIAYLVEGDDALAEFAKARIQKLESALLVRSPEEASQHRVLIRITISSVTSSQKNCCLRLIPTPSDQIPSGQKVFCVRLSYFDEKALSNEDVLTRCTHAFQEMHRLARKRAHTRPTTKRELFGQRPSRRLRQNARRILGKNEGTTP